MKEKEIKITIRSCDVSELTEDEQRLIEEAKKATAHAFSPYSHFSVGAALLLENGKTVIGANMCRKVCYICRTVAVPGQSGKNYRNSCTEQQWLPDGTCNSMRRMSAGDIRNRGPLRKGNTHLAVWDKDDVCDRESFGSFAFVVCGFKYEPIMILK